MLESSTGDIIRKDYKYLLVDEFQDVSLSQLNLVKAIVGDKRGNVTVVGDDDQSIYGFQGANIGNFNQFQQHFASKGVQTVKPMLCF
jgi:DNA helicase II / ATP-dependent DNA helicase PcrA